MSTQNALLMLDVAFDQDDDWSAFALVHGMAHERTYDAILRRGQVPLFFPLFDFPREDNAVYLFAHYETHLSQSRLLKTPGIPDLSSVDMEDPRERADWLNLHYLVHQNENAALGLP